MSNAEEDISPEEQRQAEEIAAAYAQFSAAVGPTPPPKEMPRTRLFTENIPPPRQYSPPRLQQAPPMKEREFDIVPIVLSLGATAVAAYALYRYFSAPAAKASTAVLNTATVAGHVASAPLG